MRRKGFTLVEVLVALTLSGLAITVALGVFTVSGDLIERLNASSRAWDRAANARAWIAQALSSVEVDPQANIRLVGTKDGIRFRSRVWVSDGWLELANVELAVKGNELVAGVGGRSIVLRDSVSWAAFEYLARYGGDSPWMSSWSSETGTPLAVRIRIGHRGDSEDGARADTLLFFIGQRG